MDILTKENLLFRIRLLNRDIIYWSVCLLKWRRRDGIKGLAHFIRVHESLVQHPSNDISISFPLTFSGGKCKIS